MFSAQLKEATKAAHQSLEKIIVQQIRSVQDPADYKKLLQFFYSYYQPLEQLLEPFFNNDIIPDFSTRRKAAAILDDIQQIPGPGLLPEPCTDLPRIGNTADALGVLYVLEGSTLGGAFIAKMLNKQAAIPDKQLGFFTGYAEKSIDMWNRFTDALNRYAANSKKEDEIIAAALQTFKKFEAWAAVVYASPAVTGPSVV